MARSNVAFLHTEKFFVEYQPANDILIGFGFEKTVCDDEEVWILEIPENNSAFYVKIESAGVNIFVISLWIKKHNDVDEYREYMPHDLGSLTEAKLYYDITGEFATHFDKKLKSQIIYTIE